MLKSPLPTKFQDIFKAQYYEIFNKTSNLIDNYNVTEADTLLSLVKGIKDEANEIYDSWSTFEEIFKSSKFHCC